MTITTWPVEITKSKIKYGEIMFKFLSGGSKPNETMAMSGCSCGIDNGCSEDVDYLVGYFDGKFDSAT